MALTTALVVAGAASAAAGAGISFSQASKQKKIQKEAEKAADAAALQARREISVRTTEGLELPKEAYELERRAVASQAAAALQAAREAGTRGVIGSLPGLQTAIQLGQAQVRSQMARDLFNIDVLQAKEQRKIQDNLAKLSGMELLGAQQAAADAQQARAQAIQSGVGALTGLGSTLISAGLDASAYKDKRPMQNTQQPGGITTFEGLYGIGTPGYTQQPPILSETMGDEFGLSDPLKLEKSFSIFNNTPQIGG